MSPTAEKSRGGQSLHNRGAPIIILMLLRGGFGEKRYAILLSQGIHERRLVAELTNKGRTKA
eukprot:5970257-Pyramimonas_sp.AAC.1